MSTIKTEEFVLGGSVHPSIFLSSLTVGVEAYSALCRVPKHTVAMVDAFTGDKLTFGEILNKSVQLAEALRLSGYSGQDTVICVASENRLNFFIPILAALFNISPVAPINEKYTVYELEHILNLYKPKVVFCSESFIPRLDERKKFEFIQKVIRLSENVIIHGIQNIDDFVNNALQNQNIDIHKFKPMDGDTSKMIAFLLSSSGTTGLPKGVMISHLNVMAKLAQYRDPLFMKQTNDVVLGLLPFYHIYGCMNILISLLKHQMIIVCKRFDEDLFLKTIQDYKIKTLNLIPPLMVFLASTPKLSSYDLSCVKKIVCGAAPLSTSIETEVLKRLNCKFISRGYGITEATGGVIRTTTEFKLGSEGKVLPIYVSVKIIDPNTGKSLPADKTGEVCIKGPTVMIGYYKNPKATKEAFTSDGWLKTGDLAYYDNDGFFYIVDRLKELIKYKGYQVAPAELEHILINHSKVSDAAVIGLPDELTGERPLAFVVKKPEVSVTKKEIQQYVAERVVHYKKLSGGVIFVNSIPRNSSGKILRRQLRDSLKLYQLNAKL